jgi:biotin carboxylase
MADRVLLLWPTTSYRAEDFLAAAARMRVEVVLGTDRCHELAKIWPPEAGAAPYYAAFPLDFRAPERAAGEIADLARAQAVRAIVPTDDATAVLAAQASERIGLPCNPVAAVRAARDKAELRQALASAGLPQPRFQVVAAKNPPDVEFPCIIKPLALSASRGVMRADDPPSLHAAMNRVAALLARPEIAARLGDAAGKVLVEEFIPGPEVALEGLLTASELSVLALFDKPDPLDGPTFEETIYVTPSRLPAAVQRAIADTTQRAARAIGLAEGPVHAELRLPPGGPVVIIELAARSIGGLCGRTLRFGAGISLEEVLLAHALGRTPAAPPERETRAAGVMMLPIPRAGVLKEVRGLEAAAAVAGVEAIEITTQLGQELEPLPEGASYLGFMFARAAEPADVEAALRAAHAQLELIIAPTLDVL